MCLSGTVESSTVEQGRYDGGFDGLEIDAGGRLLSPGLVDVHVHGGDGHDTMDATPQALDGMARYFAAHGVTGSWRQP